MIKTPKALFHPDGALYVIWHEDKAAYCPVFSDEDVPPAPETLDMNVFDEEYASKPVWRPVRLTAERSVIEIETVTAPYDSETGEQI
jgi:hypothetical protein